MASKVKGVLFKIIKRNVHNRGVFKDIGIIGVPFNKGQPKPGVSNGPDAIRNADIVQKLKEINANVDIKDFGNISYKSEADVSNVPNMKGYADMASCNYEISRNVEKIIKDNRICLTLGGDHAIGVGTVDGHLKAKNGDICVLWVDAHADLNTNKTSDTGNVHGMPMALIANELSDYWPYLPGMDWQKPILSIRNVAYVGLRSIDNYERLIIDKLGITAFGIEDVEDYGISKVVNMALNKIDPSGDKSIHVSFDIDALDSLEAPSTGCSVRGGLTLREGVQIMEMIHRTGRLGALDLAEVNPEIGTEADVRKTVEAATLIIQAAFGFSRRGLRPCNDVLPLQTFPPTRAVI